MHEGTIMKDLIRKIESVAREAGAERVTAVKVRLGALSEMSEAHFREHFEASSLGTLAAGASLAVHATADLDPEAQKIVLESVEVAG